MSSFKRKGAGRQEAKLSGTRLSPTSNSTLITSTGTPSLDDLLGGGLPLSCSLLTLASDLHSSYGDLVQKYFIAQGLACKQHICVIHHDAGQFVQSCMWLGRATQDERTDSDAQKIKIAWRYDQMKQFQTTVTPSTSSDEEYCLSFDLAAQIPQSVVDNALDCQKLSYVRTEPSISQVLASLSNVIDHDREVPLRICIPSLGSPYWGDLSAQDILHFLHSLRSLLRQHPTTCASVSLAPHIASDKWGGVGWINKLGWMSDASVSLTAFTADPSLTAEFPSYHGFVHIHSLPSPHTLTAASDKHSTLRSFSSSGENNLAFKCTRKRFIIETLHLDVEGGVNERRTMPSTTPAYDGGGSARVKIELEEKDAPKAGKDNKGKRKVVAFDDMYDF